VINAFSNDPYPQNPQGHRLGCWLLSDSSILSIREGLDNEIHATIPN